MASRNSGLGAAVLFCIFVLAKTSDGQGIGSECWGVGMCGAWNIDCVNFVCTCRPGYIPSANILECIIGINGQCVTSSDKCYDENAHCDRSNNWRCSCKPGFSQGPDGQLCYRALGKECEADGLSCADGSCVDEICQCGAGLEINEFGDSCGVSVGGSCAAGGTACADANAVCSSDNICQCKEEYQRAVTAEGLTVCRKGLGIQCSSSNECAPTNSSCETMLNGKGVCTCNVGYVPSENRASCLQVTNHWKGVCQENTQCIAGFGRHSLCQSSACTCANGYAYSFEDFGCVL